MKPWIMIDTATTPDGGVIALYRHDQSYAIRVNGYELMSTRTHASEEALATLTCQPLSAQKKVRVLIGGLGLGFTLRAALSALGRDAHIVVAELIPAVVAWNRNPLYPLASATLADPRVQVMEQDVLQIIRASPASFDAILLDVDNGPAAVSVEVNQRLYRAAGLRQAQAALRPGGCLGIWSAQADPAFAKLLHHVGFTVTTHTTPAHATSGPRHTVLIGHVR